MVSCTFVIAVYTLLLAALDYSKVFSFKRRKFKLQIEMWDSRLSICLAKEGTETYGSTTTKNAKALSS